MNEKEIQQYEKLVLTPINKLIPSLAIPTIISMMTSMIYNLVDAFFVGRLGTSASGAVGILISVTAVFQAIGFMHGHGSGSIISLRLGSGDHDAATKFASIAFYGCIAVSTVTALFCLSFIEPIMKLLGSTDTILPYAVTYGVYMLISAPALAGSCVLNNIMRYEGKAFYAMIGLVSGGVLNMIADPILMFGFGLGIRGAGLSTAVSQYISFFILLYMFKSGKTISKISAVALVKGYSPRDHAMILKNGLPSLLRQTFNSISSMTLNICANPYGDAAIAAMAIVGRIIMFVGAAMIGIGQGFQPVAAYNYGAGKNMRIREGFRFTFILGEGVLTLLALFCLISPERIVAVFRDDPLVIQIGTKALRFQAASVMMQPLSVVANMTFQAIGKAKAASLMSTLRSGLYYIPLLIILPKVIGLTGIECAQMVSDLLTLLTVIPFVVLFFRRLPKADRQTAIDEKYRLSLLKEV